MIILKVLKPLGPLHFLILIWIDSILKRKKNSNCDDVIVVHPVIIISIFIFLFNWLFCVFLFFVFHLSGNSMPRNGKLLRYREALVQVKTDLFNVLYPCALTPSFWIRQNSQYIWNKTSATTAPHPHTSPHCFLKKKFFYPKICIIHCLHRHISHLIIFHSQYR